MTVWCFVHHKGESQFETQDNYFWRAVRLKSGGFKTDTEEEVLPESCFHGNQTWRQVRHFSKRKKCANNYTLTDVSVFPSTVF